VFVFYMKADMTNCHIIFTR